MPGPPPPRPAPPPPRARRDGPPPPRAAPPPPRAAPRPQAPPPARRPPPAPIAPQTDARDVSDDGWTRQSRVDPTGYHIRDPDGHPPGSYITPGGILVSGLIHFLTGYPAERLRPVVTTTCGLEAPPYRYGVRASPWVSDVTCPRCIKYTDDQTRWGWLQPRGGTETDDDGNERKKERKGRKK